MMVKNVIFDFGQVMVRFDPVYMVGRYVTDAKDAALLEAVIFDRLYWDPLDAGTVTDGEVVEAVKARIPERLHEVAETIYYSWIYNLPEIEGMRELVYSLRKRGIRVFLLSNISEYFARHADEIPVLREFERCFFSAVMGKTKPHREIYEEVCQTTGILPEETLFVDDSAVNIRGAEEYGIRGYLFDGDASRLSIYLNGIIGG